jgi:hypothetical protein
MLQFIKLLIFFNFLKSILCEKELNCRFYQYGDDYICHVFGVDNYELTEGDRVLFTGNHIGGKSNVAVTKLVLHRMWMDNFPVNIFKQFPNLRCFGCDLCWLRNIRQVDFVGAPDLDTLYIRMGMLQKLDSDIFKHSNKLEAISIAGHEISVVDRKAFGGLKNLKKLYLYHNLIKDLSVGLFDDLTSLEKLDMRYNRIETLRPNLFKFNNNLRVIKFANNEISIIAPNLISHLSKLNAIDFTDNKCGERFEFYENYQAFIHQTFDRNVQNCTTENLIENKLQSTINENEDLKVLNLDLKNKNSILIKKILNLMKQA